MVALDVVWSLLVEVVVASGVELGKKWHDADKPDFVFVETKNLKLELIFELREGVLPL